uniref:uncharacterized protein LOC109970460 n=1 Tax=Monopterus albus TaxID=43700 RepID=UPI0009B43E39|nr:uncharacterized protein LOC109970460 [Monopterus albus]XP_020473682.1 uncharacterized protein LOC109970460 [Monopterus albus]XP_020473683.1 uncharacterized protein LOC109970460 [Monopterus albus]
MGNIVQCCGTLSNYFKCKDAPAQGEAERSPLLSSEESECESPSLPDDLEDDVLTVSASVTNLAPEPEHFLFPDIILSSSLGGDMTLVEPMVCLLVSEEEDGRGEGVRVDEGQERSNAGKIWGYSEVETQTEVETQMGMGVQTQTESQAEVQTQTETLVYNNKTVVRDVNTLTNTGTRQEMAADVKKEHEMLKRLDVLSEVQTDTQTSQERHSRIVTDMLLQKQKKRIVDSTAWSDINIFAELELPGKMETQQETNKLAFGDIDKEAEQERLKENHIHEHIQTEHSAELKEVLNSVERNVFKLQQKTIGAQENIDWIEQHILQKQEAIKDKERNNQSECTSVVLTEQNINKVDVAMESQKPTKYSIRNTDTVLSDQKVNEEEHHIIPTKTNIIWSEDQADYIHCQENLHTPQREEDNNKTGLQHVLELETVLQPLEEDGAEMKQKDFGPAGTRQQH